MDPNLSTAVSLWFVGDVKIDRPSDLGRLRIEISFQFTNFLPLTVFFLTSFNDQLFLFNPK